MALLKFLNGKVKGARSGGGHSGVKNLQEGTRYFLIEFLQNQDFETFFLIITDLRLFLL